MDWQPGAPLRSHLQLSFASSWRDDHPGPGHRFVVKAHYRGLKKRHALGTDYIMKCQVPIRANRARSIAFVMVSLVLAVAMGLPTQIFAAPKRPAAATFPASVTANYRISFGVFGDIGSYRFKSELGGGKYSLVADAKIETAVLDYSAVMRSAGSFVSEELKPESHMYRFKQNPLIGKKKRSTLNMAFDDRGVTNVEFVPKKRKKPSKHKIPVTEKHLENVLDPLSAIMALSLDGTGDPCRRTISVFDGNQRFDLIFTPKRQSSSNIVCSVRFVPISGHSKGEESSVITGNAEVKLRRVPKAKIVIPSRITVPTIAGNAVLTSNRIVITMPDRKRIAFKQ